VVEYLVADHFGAELKHLFDLAAPNGAACFHIGLGLHCPVSFLGFPQMLCLPLADYELAAPNGRASFYIRLGLHFPVSFLWIPLNALPTVARL
jgi:hypothetical protein